jgi:hypothetical protein
MGVIDSAKVTRLALLNAGSIASLILTIDRMVADAPKKTSGRPSRLRPTCSEADRWAGNPGQSFRNSCCRRTASITLLINRKGATRESV